jgi:hypothetical protein
MGGEIAGEPLYAATRAQPLMQRIFIGEEPDRASPIGFANEVAKRFAFGLKRAGIPDNGDGDLVGDEFLHHLSSDSRVQFKKCRIEAGDGDND